MKQQINEIRRMQLLAGLINESQLNEAETINVNQTYIYKHPKAGPVKVKALGASSWGDEYFVVEALEDKGEVTKGKQFNAAIKDLYESQLNEDKIPFFHLTQITRSPLAIDKPKADQMSDLKVGLYVLPKKAYRDESDIKAALGKITKIEGDNVTVEKVNGEEHNYKKSDLVHLIDGGYQFESQLDEVVDKVLAKLRGKK